MRTSQLFAPTLRQVSGEVELASHKLLLRAGYIRQVAAGVYSLLPLGLRVAHKIETIIREEMDAAGAQEVLLPALHPLESVGEVRPRGVLGRRVDEAQGPQRAALRLGRHA